MAVKVEHMALAFPDGFTLKVFSDRDDFTERGLAVMELFNGALNRLDRNAHTEEVPLDSSFESLFDGFPSLQSG